MPDILHRFTIDAPRERGPRAQLRQGGRRAPWNAHPNEPTGETSRLELSAPSRGTRARGVDSGRAPDQ
jgi:hypothetical protein